MAGKKNVFVSFDYDNDKRYKYLLEAWDANPKFNFVFRDKTPGEINTNDIGRIKAGLTRKINEATYTLFIVGQHANQAHRHRSQIGMRTFRAFAAEAIDRKRTLLVGDSSSNTRVWRQP